MAQVYFSLNKESYVENASWYKENLTYQQDLTPSKKVRQGKITWLNPPYSMNVKTNIGKTF